MSENYVLCPLCGKKVGTGFLFGEPLEDFCGCPAEDNEDLIMEAMKELFPETPEDRWRDFLK